jgi:hypothetical protein
MFTSRLVKEYFITRNNLVHNKLGNEKARNLTRQGHIEILSKRKPAVFFLHCGWPQSGICSQRTEESFTCYLRIWILGLKLNITAEYLTILLHIQEVLV